jgi:phage terminase large subunit
LQRVRISAPEIFAPLFKPARYKGGYGGRGSAKSHTFGRALILDSLRHPGMRSVCVREVQNSLEESVKRLLEDTIQEMGVGDRFLVQQNRIHTPGSGLVIFEGMQNHTAESIKSLEGYRRCWCEEAQTLSKKSLELLTPTIREEDSELWFSWNPRYPTDPVDAFFRGGAPPPDSVLIRANYTDNPFLPDVLRKEAEWCRDRDPDQYAHVWLGEYERHSEARVFKNWKVEAFETPHDATFYYGGDWGFSIDPTVLVRCFLNPETRTLYIDREVYQVGCEIDHTPELFDQLDGGQARKWPITADSARPETISYMQRHGYPRVRAAKKGAGSLEEGITFLQNFKILVHPRCRHAIDELTLYHYETDKLTGDILPKLADKKNHVIDALRYAVETLRMKVGGGVFHMAGL